MSVLSKLCFGLLLLPLQAGAMEVERAPIEEAARTAPVETTTTRVIVLAPATPRAQGVRPAIVAPRVPPERARCPMPFTGGLARPTVAGPDSCVWFVQVPNASKVTLSLDALTAVAPSVERIRVLRADGKVLYEHTGELTHGTSITGLPATFVLRVDADPVVGRAIRAHVVPE